MKNVVKCVEDFFAYFMALKTKGDRDLHTDRFLVEMCHNYAFKE